MALKAAMAGGNRAGAADLSSYENALGAARSNLREAVSAEIDASTGHRPTGDIYDAGFVRRQGAAIAERYTGDPATKAAIDREVAGLATDREVSDTKTILLAQKDPATMGKLMATELPKLSPDAQNRLLNDPDIRNWIAGPLREVDSAKITTSDAQIAASHEADAFARRLAGVTAALSPEQAQALTKSLMPEIQKAGEDKLIPTAVNSGNTRFADLSRVVSRLGDAPDADALVNEIARSYADVLGNAPFAGQTVHDATVGEGGPRLAVAVARTLQGRNEVPPSAVSDIMGGVQTGVDQLRSQVDHDMQEYGQHLAKIDAATRSTQGLPGAAEARQRYIDSQPQAFKDRMKELSGIAADGGTRLTKALAGLADMPPGLDRDTSLQTVLQQVGEDKAAQTAMIMGAQKNPDALIGTEGKQAIEALTAVKMGKEGTEFVRGFTGVVIGLNQSAAIDLAKSGDIVGAQSKLAQWADPVWGERLGMDPKDYTGLTGKLDEVLQAAGDPAKANAALGEMRDMLDNRGELMEADTTAGRLFRGLNLAASITLAGKSLNEALNEGGVDKWLSAAGDSAGVAKDGYDLIAALAGKGAATSTKWFLGIFGGLSVAADVGKMFTGETSFDKGASAVSAMGGGFMLAAGVLGGPAGMAYAFMGASLTIIIEWAKGEHEQKKQLEDLTKSSGEVLKLLVEHGLDPAAIPSLSRRGGDSGEFAATPILTGYLADRGFSPEQALAWINDAARGGKLDSVMDTAVELAEEVGDDPDKADTIGGRLDETVHRAGLPERAPRA
ncbi:hypothetical protein G4G27_22055 [Sphingomonas sp. So64.6b]|uniref:hypothetical protein n=1 Tax=Sphingomonas sp. So64.6b TaxID=2997354 RepID=UPI0015FFC36D|nr:hypothetical protein [Sphingomonas sp. So64.6b]QNA86362.1 hypothetical protein G4G27_22055 [Sphingomonas sp. So64.6b]